MALALYDTLTREKRVFEPRDRERVTMYVCGPTVYSYAHIGNARPAVAFDVLYRLLRQEYGADHVVYARNITDIDDKIIAAAREADAEIGAITEKFAAIYRDDMGALGVMRPNLEPAATARVAEMIDALGRLVAKGAAYAAEGHVLFSVSAAADYGALSKRSRDDQIAGARVEVAPYKKDPADFVLWKPSAADEPGWESPWGRGRPGWHTECAVMIETDLGPTIDIHGGGQDLIFPHHENEIAQAACLHDGAPLARYWLHNGFLTMDAEKMSKSLGNVTLVHDLLKAWKGEELRFALLSAHYRQPLDWTDALLRQSRATLDGWYRAKAKLAAHAPAEDAPREAADALEDDLNTPMAFSAVSALAAAAQKETSGEALSLYRAGFDRAAELLGLAAQDPDAWFQGDAGDGPSTDEIETLIAQRQAARLAKDFEKSDRIRDELAAMGVVIEDGPAGATWRRAPPSAP